MALSVIFVLFPYAIETRLYFLQVGLDAKRHNPTFVAI